MDHYKTRMRQEIFYVYNDVYYMYSKEIFMILLIREKINTATKLQLVSQPSVETNGF